MAVYYIGSYDILNTEEFKQYPPKVMALLPKYGGQVLASDVEATGRGYLQRNKNPLPANEYNVALFEFKNALQAYRKDYSNLKFGYDNLKVKMEESIELIREEYNLE